MMSVALPSSRGPITMMPTLTTVSAAMIASRTFSAPRMSPSRRTVTRKFELFSAGIPAAPPGPKLLRRAAAPVVVRISRSSSGCAVVAHALGSRSNCESTISAYVGHVSSSATWRPRPTIRPLSSTMI